MLLRLKISISWRDPFKKEWLEKTWGLKSAGDPSPIIAWRRVASHSLNHLATLKSLLLIDQLTIKTPHPKYRLYWCLIEFIDRRYSPSCWYFPVLRIRDVYPGSRILIFTHPGSRISDPGFRIQKQQQKRGVKKICCHTFSYSHKFHKIVNYFSFEVLKKKIWPNFQRIIELFTQKIVT